MFKGICFIKKDGEYCPPVKLDTPEEVFSYVNLQKRIFPEIRIIDENDFTVVQALEGKVVFPPEWAEIEKGG